MTTDNQRAHWNNASEGSREAAQWALRLLGGFQSQDSAAAAMELDELLRGQSLDRRVAFLAQLVNLTGRVGVASPDVATLKVKLRALAEGPAPDALAGR